MSISFKEFSNLLEKPQKTSGGSGKFKSTAAKFKTAKGSSDKGGKLGGGLGTKISGFGKTKLSGFDKPGKKQKPETSKNKKSKKSKVAKTPVDKKKKPGFFGKYFTQKPDAAEIEKEKKQKEKEAEKERLSSVVSDKVSRARKDRALEIERGEQEKKRREGLAKYREREKEKKRKRIEADKKERETEGDNEEKKKKRIEKKNKAIEKEKKNPILNPKREEIMHTEASRKANKLHIMHSAKQIGKIKDSEERERQAKDLEKKAKKMGFGRAEIEKILDNQGAYGEEYAMKKTMEEAEKMHSYMNTLSLERTANIWSEAAKKDEDLDPVQGSKTLTKKTQEKVTINPMEKQAIRTG